MNEKYRSEKRIRDGLKNVLIYPKKCEILRNLQTAYKTQLTLFGVIIGYFSGGETFFYNLEMRQAKKRMPDPQDGRRLGTLSLDFLPSREKF